MKKLLLDTDIGNDIDDALALAYLLQEPECELLGVTTVCGEPEKRAEMASAICRNLGRDDIPIHPGCKIPPSIPPRQPTCPQAAGLGDWPRRRFEPDGSAVDFLRRTIRANPGEVTLLAIRPLTNVATLFSIDPDIPALLKGLYLMCGRFFEVLGGEWNAFLDPWATGIVYGNSTHARPPVHVSYGLDVTLHVQLPRDEARARFAGIRALDPVRDFAEVWFERSNHVTFHDPLAAVGLFHPEVCQYKDAFVRVSQSEPTLGWTIPTWPDESQRCHRLACSVDAPAFFSTYFDTLRRA
jgi:inosine-uridine nucleoside N-ribohydrolase